MTDEAKAFFRAYTYTVIGDARNTLFWTNSWISGMAIGTFAPTLLHFVSRRAQTSLTVAQALQSTAWVRTIGGGLSIPAAAEYLRVWRAIRDIALTEQPDQLIWRWKSDGKFSVRSAYLALHQGSHSIPGCVLVWEIWALTWVKIFLWLALRRRHWTADRRCRHDLDAHDTCHLCDQEPETMDHIIVACSITRQIWFQAAASLNQGAPTASGVLIEYNGGTHGGRNGRATGVRAQIRCLPLIARETWKETNARCFRGAATDVNALISVIKFRTEERVEAGAKHLGSLISRVVG
jgi:hypothetical protein